MQYWIKPLLGPAAVAIALCAGFHITQTPSIGCSRLMQSTTVLQPTKTQPITSLCANGSINWRGTFFLLNFCNRLIGRVISPRERAKQSTGAQSTIRQSESSPMIYSSQTLNKCSISPLNNPLKYPPAHCALYERLLHVQCTQ